MRYGILMSVLTISLFITSEVKAIVLPVPAVIQQQKGWCWAACSEAVARYYGVNINQCTFAEEYRVGRNWRDWRYYPISDYPDCCSTTYVYRDENTGSWCNSGNWLFPEPNSTPPSYAPETSVLLNNHNFTTQQGDYRELSINEIYTEIDGNPFVGTGGGRPFIIGWSWPDLGPDAKHAVVGRGIVNQGGNTFIYYMDPFPTDNYQIQQYDWVVNNYGKAADQNNPEGGSFHIWERTLRMAQGSIPQMPIPDIKVNGYDGPYYASSGQTLNITAALNPGEYSDKADWWVSASFNGQLFYQNKNGNLQSDATPRFEQPAPLTTHNYFQIFNGTLPSGTYIFYFGVDLMQNDVLDNPLYYDILYLTVY